MKFVILSTIAIPEYNGVRGPVLSPMEYDVHLVLKWITAGLDVREVMEDGSYRKLNYNDEKLIGLLNKKLNKKAVEKKKVQEVVRPIVKKEESVKKPEEKKVEVKSEPIVQPKVEEQKVEDDVLLLIDELEKPE